MSNYIIACDLDGVGYNFVDRLRMFINEYTGKPIRQMPPARSWNFFSDQWGLTAAEYNEYVMEGVRQGFLFREGKAIPGFKDALDYFGKVRGDYVKIVTSRAFPGLEEAAATATKQWLENENILFNELVLTEDKAAVTFDLLIDDAPHHIENAIIAGADAIVFDQPWNRHMTYPPRAHGWQEVIEYIDKNYPIFSQV